MESVLQKYEFQIVTIQKEREQLLKKEIYLPLLRFISFLLVLVWFYKYLIVSDISFVYFSGTSLLTFLFLTWWDNILKRKIERCTRLINICRNEIRSIIGDFSPFEIGDEYINSDHSYSYDLDLFGKNSLFNCINRSVTIFGKNRLADYFISAYNYKNLIFERQKAIAELSENVEFVNSYNWFSLVRQVLKKRGWSLLNGSTAQILCCTTEPLMSSGIYCRQLQLY